MVRTIKNRHHTNPTGKCPSFGLFNRWGIIRCQIFVMFVLFVVQIPVNTSCAKTTSRTENLIRSAMVFNFCKFVQWPTAVSGDQPNDTTLVLAIIGDPGNSPDFSSLAGKTINNYSIEVRYITSVEDLESCQLAFIASDQVENLPEILHTISSHSILTISEIDDFCASGGIIQLVERRGKLRFFINRTAAENAELILSSQLLKMARIVEGR